MRLRGQQTPRRATQAFHEPIAPTRPARRVLTPLFAVGLVGGLASALDAMLGTGPSWTHTPLINIAHVAVLLLPLAFLAGVWRVRMGRTAVADLLRRMPLASRAGASCESSVAAPTESPPSSRPSSSFTTPQPEV